MVQIIRKMKYFGKQRIPIKVFDLDTGECLIKFASKATACSCNGNCNDRNPRHCIEYGDLVVRALKNGTFSW